MGERGWQHLLNNHEKGMLVDRFEQTLLTLCAESPAS
jgi:hypothetical protein